MAQGVACTAALATRTHLDIQLHRCRQDNNMYPKKLKFCEFIPHKYELNTGTSGWTSEGRGFLLSSNKTNYSGHLCKDNAIYLKTIHSELTEIQPIRGHLGIKSI